MKEKDFQGLFSLWVDSNKKFIKDTFGKFVAFELKIEKSRSIRFDRIAIHQKEAMIDVEGVGCYHKINDMPFIKNNPQMRFTNKKPFDCFFGCGFAYVVVWFYKKGQKKEDREMILIPIRDWVREWIIAEKEERKSIREEYLRTIGTVINFCR